jgi:L-threonylcarbamoyladenylate synthase
METQLIAQDDPQVLSLAVELILAGEVIAFPTDTVYGIGARADSEAAIEKLYQIKARSFDKPIPVMVATVGQLEQVVNFVSVDARRLAARFWPGPLTLVLPKRASLPDNLTQLPGVGVRIPDHRFALNLLKRCGPLAVTSANLSGQVESLSAKAVLSQLEGLLVLVVDGGDSPGGTASTVVDLVGEHPRILRQGPISAEKITQALTDPA